MKVFRPQVPTPASRESAPGMLQQPPRKQSEELRCQWCSSFTCAAHHRFNQDTGQQSSKTPLGPRLLPISRLLWLHQPDFCLRTSDSPRPPSGALSPSFLRAGPHTGFTVTFCSNLISSERSPLPSETATPYLPALVSILSLFFLCLGALI